MSSQASIDVVRVGHIGHRAAGGHVREDDADLSGFVRMSADSAMKWTPQKRTYSASFCCGGVLGELEAVAGEVGVLDDFVALVVVAEDDEASPSAARAQVMRRSSLFRASSRYSRGMSCCQLTNAGSSASGTGMRASVGQVSGSV